MSTLKDTHKKYDLSVTSNQLNIKLHNIDLISTENQILFKTSLLLSHLSLLGTTGLVSTPNFHFGLQDFLFSGCAPASSPPLTGGSLAGEGHLAVRSFGIGIGPVWFLMESLVVPCKTPLMI